MGSAEQASTMTERIRNAEETLEKARIALEKAQTGLRAAEEVAETADEMRAHPVRLVLVLVATVGVVAAIMTLVRRRTAD